MWICVFLNISIAHNQCSKYDCAKLIKICPSEYFDPNFINFHRLFIKSSKSPSLSLFLLCKSACHLLSPSPIINSPSTIALNLLKLPLPSILILLLSISVNFSSSHQKRLPCLSFFYVNPHFPSYIYRPYSIPQIRLHFTDQIRPFRVFLSYFRQFLPSIRTVFKTTLPVCLSTM